MAAGCRPGRSGGRAAGDRAKNFLRGGKARPGRHSSQPPALALPLGLVPGAQWANVVRRLPRWGRSIVGTWGRVLFRLVGGWPRRLHGGKPPGPRSAGASSTGRLADLVRRLPAPCGRLFDPGIGGSRAMKGRKPKAHRAGFQAPALNPRRQTRGIRPAAAEYMPRAGQNGPRGPLPGTAPPKNPCPKRCAPGGGK